MGGWWRNHGYQVFMAVMVSAMAIGQWRSDLSGATNDIAALDRRVAFLEERLLNEQTRLSAIYMTRELSVSQMTDIGRQLQEIKDELKIIRRQGQ